MRITLILLAGAATGMAASLKRTVLKQHNRARALHGAAKLKWSNELAGIAQSHTNTCVFSHKIDGDYGQNIGWASAASGGDDDAVNEMADMITDAWYGEVSKFTEYGASTPNTARLGEWGHFTQVVWNATTEVGCAYSTCNAGAAHMFICNYSPPGNVGGQYAVNVAPKV
ncbi:CAP domain-containing protein [Microdochium trichocladiopsis]|uniref:CAP domain-containing protein n=1 Tax=Microdochium trichocladiopsis TaxID=1682393 RepID=A0A9P8YDM6_9PEZI|nr:CAP domain-containing protein [Microdochium trichocladiopsis]KAH7035995.1 CAP domain-containing protein [Microdochium trichocladiopsis]